MNSIDEKGAFAARLNEVCSDMGLPAERGRQTELAKLFKLTPNAVRKWLLGEGLPELEVAISIAKWSGVNLESLLTGRGTKKLGELVDTKALVLGEAIHELPEDDRQQALDFVRYKIERSTAVLGAEKFGRYMVMLEAFSKVPKPPGPPPRKPK
jgi:transcriptional regulator with XRE-family HTH domain